MMNTQQVIRSAKMRGIPRTKGAALQTLLNDAHWLNRQLHAVADSAEKETPRRRDLVVLLKALNRFSQHPAYIGAGKPQIVSEIQRFIQKARNHILVAIQNLFFGSNRYVAMGLKAAALWVTQIAKAIWKLFKG
jgi:hypothetical protein